MPFNNIASSLLLERNFFVPFFFTTHHGEFDNKSISKLNLIENSIRKIEIEKVPNNYFNLNSLDSDNSKYSKFSENIKKSTDGKIIFEEENLARKEEIQKRAKLSDIFYFSRSFWILTISSFFVYGKEIDEYCDR